jgi:hypothetical protein
MDPTRRIQVFIVTLLIEGDGELRGRVRPVRADNETAFTGEAQLLELLHQGAAAPVPSTDPLGSDVRQGE